MSNLKGAKKMCKSCFMKIFSENTRFWKPLSERNELQIPEYYKRIVEEAIQKLMYQKMT